MVFTCANRNIPGNTELDKSTNKKTNSKCFFYGNQEHRTLLAS